MTMNTIPKNQIEKVIVTWSDGVVSTYSGSFYRTEIQHLHINEFAKIEIFYKNQQFIADF